MRPFLSLLALGLSVASAPDKTEVQLMAGAAEVAVNPLYPDTEGLETYGDLYARTLVLGDGTQRIAIVTVDVGTLHFPFIRILLKSISHATGIPEGNIAVNWSHSHNATLIESGPYQKWLDSHIVGIVKEACENLQPATICIGREPAQIAYNRRLMRDGQIVMAPNPKGAIVPWTDVLGAYSQDGERIGVLFSYAAHPVIVHFPKWPDPEPVYIGPDYPGYAVDHLHNLLDNDGKSRGVYMFAQGCSGNVNGFPLRGGLGAADAAGLSLAFAASRGLADAKPIAPAPLKVHALTISLPYRVPTVAECEELLAEDPENEDYHWLMDIAKSGERRYEECPMFAFALGNDLCIVCLPGELFAEYQLFADEISPFAHTLVLGDTNGRVGYVATKKDYDLGHAGGYEASSKGRLSLDPSVEQVVQDGIRRLLIELKEM